MTRNSTLGFGKKRKNYAVTVLMIITAAAVVATLLLASTFIYLNSRIKKNEASIATFSKEIANMQEKVEGIKAQESEYKSKLQALELEISKYEPVIIPDSMKNQSN